jgi:hypothetical protein
VLIFNSMLPQNASAFSSYNVLSSLSELISNQLSNAISQIDPNLNVDVSTTGTSINQDLINNLQLRLSYNFNDRFRITRSGGFTNATNQANAQSLIGDWALEWFVTRDGSLRLKTFNRNLQTTLGIGALNNINQTGASILYTKSFNFLFSGKNKPQSAIGQGSLVLNEK